MEQEARSLKDARYDSTTVAFIDLAGFSAIADVYGDSTAVAMLELFETMVAGHLKITPRDKVDRRRGHALFSRSEGRHQGTR